VGSGTVPVAEIRPCRRNAWAAGDSRPMTPLYHTTGHMSSEAQMHGVTGTAHMAPACIVTAATHTPGDLHHYPAVERQIHADPSSRQSTAALATGSRNANGGCPGCSPSAQGGNSFDIHTIPQFVPRCKNGAVRNAPPCQPRLLSIGGEAQSETRRQTAGSGRVAGTVGVRPETRVGDPLGAVAAGGCCVKTPVGDPLGAGDAG